MGKVLGLGLGLGLGLWLCLLHPSCGLSASPGMKEANAMRKWLVDGGAFLSPKVQAQLIPGVGFGLTAADYIKDNEVLCAIPREYCMYGYGDEGVTEIATQLRQAKFHSSGSGPSGDDSSGDPSHFQPFVDVLPADVSFLPCMWGEPNLALIEGTSLGGDATMMMRSWLASYEECVRPGDEERVAMEVGARAGAGGAGSVTEVVDKVADVDTLRQQWLWARASIQCRAYAFRVPAPEDKQKARNKRLLNQPGVEQVDSQELSQAGLTLLTLFFPFIGFANHDDFKYCFLGPGNGIDYPQSSLVLRSQHRYLPGEPVCISYGDMSFQQKALSFGWIDTTVGEFKPQPKIFNEGEEDEHFPWCITPLDVGGAGTRTQMRQGQKQG
ncbi:hypothetical protein B484DRAFT_400977 [Ochromonadaceae sp. CCMP2298]|nr:hypothetical protein B484DRAFT_400977 [Ochromonadaceae sp. CCMP2298]